VRIIQCERKILIGLYGSNFFFIAWNNLPSALYFIVLWKCTVPTWNIVVFRVVLRLVFIIDILTLRWEMTTCIGEKKINWARSLASSSCSLRYNSYYIGVGYFCNLALRYLKLYLLRFFFLHVTALCIFVCTAVITITWNLLVLFHIVTMFSYPKLVWRIRLTRDLSVRVSLWETIVGIWVWLLWFQFCNYWTSSV
jgi:hypothetical protein